MEKNEDPFTKKMSEIYKMYSMKEAAMLTDPQMLCKFHLTPYPIIFVKLEYILVKH